MLEAISPAPLDTPPQARLASAPRLRLGPGQRLLLQQAGQSVCVQPVRCFPWSAPGELISLRDADEREHHLVEHLDQLDAESRQALASAMQSAGFVLEVEEVLSVEEDYEVRCWRARGTARARFRRASTSGPGRRPTAAIWCAICAATCFACRRWSA